MKTKTLLVLFTTAAALAIAQTPVYTAAEAAKHVGEIATITDKVDGVHQSGKGNIFLNMGGKYRLIKCLAKGKLWVPGEKPQASVYLWLLK